jgi:hypothetical protein
MLLLVLILAAAGVLSSEPRALFNGRDLSGWVHEGPRATFSASQGALSTSGRGGPPVWLRTEAEFANFRLTFEYKLARWAEAAVILRAPRAGRPMQSGIAIYLAHDFHDNVTPYITGAIAGVAPPLKRLPTRFETWHTASVELDGDRLRVVVDGTALQDLDLEAHSELRYRLKRGYIGFPDLGHAYAVRNVQLDDRGSKRKFVELFDGKSLDGWQVRGEGGSWSAAGGCIKGANGHSILYSAPVLQDFEFTALVRSRNRVNAGVFFRGSPDTKEHRGFEVQVYSPLDSVYPTGSIYGKQRARVQADYEERWFLMQVRVMGSRCVVRLDGETVAEYDKLSGADLEPGRIGLQIHLEDASVEFRDLRVRRL